MKRRCRGIKKIIWMKWKLLTFTKSVTRRLGRFHSLKKYQEGGRTGQKPKKASRPSDRKKTTTKAGKKVKKASQLKKAPKSPEFIDSSKEEEGPSQDDKGKKKSPLLWVKEEVKSFFDLQKDSKNLTIEKKVEKVVFMA